MKLSTWFISFCLGLSFLAGALLTGASFADGATDLTSLDVSALSPRARALKTEIMDLAEAGRGVDDRDGSLQAELNVKINELLNITVPVSSSEKLRRLSGAWEQVFGPTYYTGLGPVKIDPNFVYQVIHPDGYYYNITRTELMLNRRRTKVTVYLRGDWTWNGDQLHVDASGSMFYTEGYLPEGVNVYDLARLAEAGTITGPDVPIPAGRGPKNRLGVVREVYVDGDIRISYGSNENADPQFGTLYVMRRAEATKAFASHD